jgi:hypothetical protein
MPDSAVYVGRGSPWGNPFVVGQDGTAAECARLYGVLLSGMICLTTKASAVDQRVVLDHVRAHLGDLKGRDLACWCRPGAPCHADVLLELANGQDGADAVAAGP